MRSGEACVAVAGLGGFAAEHHAALAALESEGACRVVAACDPSPSLAASERFRLRERGVEVFDDLGALLSAHRRDLAMVTLPTPLPLHAAHHRSAVEAGVPCYLEKPPTLWWPEYRAMREVEGSATRATQVGFNFVGDPLRREIKERILSGEFGRLREARLHAVWPRDEAYYARNDWAGRLRAGDAGPSTRASGTPWRTTSRTSSSGAGKKTSMPSGESTRYGLGSPGRAPSRASTPRSWRRPSRVARGCASGRPTPPSLRTQTARS